MSIRKFATFIGIEFAATLDFYQCRARRIIAEMTTGECGAGPSCGAESCRHHRPPAPTWCKHAQAIRKTAEVAELNAALRARLT
jgi:hypothetical protein